MAVESGHFELADALQAIRDQFASPEHINNDPSSAPSKRILALMAGYDKVTTGSLVALETGLECMRSECSLFNRWVESLLAVTESPA